MEQPKENKKLEPKPNKMVRIHFRPGRAAEGVTMDENRYATVDADTAKYLIEINYAVMAEENQ